MTKKPISAILTSDGTYDLMVERDACNLIRILTGSDDKQSREFWVRINSLSEKVIENLSATKFWDRAPNIEG